MMYIIPINNINAVISQNDVSSLYSSVGYQGLFKLDPKITAIVFIIHIDVHTISKYAYIFRY